VLEHLLESRRKPLCQVILSGYERDRIRAALERYRPFKIIVLENGQPLREHEEIKRRVHNELTQLFKNMGYLDEKTVSWEGVDFYNMNKALPQVYEVLLKESRDFDVMVNITGGTKPLSAATTLAAAFARTSVVYFMAKEYEIRQGESVAKGVIETPFFLDPLFYLSDALLDFKPDESKILSALLNGPKRKISEIVGTSARAEKVRRTARYSYYLRKLELRHMIRNSPEGFRLTGVGLLTAKLVAIRDRYKSSILATT